MTTFLLVVVLLAVAAAAVLADMVKDRIGDAERCRCPVCEGRR